MLPVITLLALLPIAFSGDATPCDFKALTACMTKAFPNASPRLFEGGSSVEESCRFHKQGIKCAKQTKCSGPQFAAQQEYGNAICDEKSIRDNFQSCIVPSERKHKTSSECGPPGTTPSTCRKAKEIFACAAESIVKDCPKVDKTAMKRLMSARAQFVCLELEAREIRQTRTAAKDEH